MTEYVYEVHLASGLVAAEYHLKECAQHCVDKSVRIVRVDNSDGKWHICPYSVEILNDHTLCCCDEHQEHECRMDI